MKYTAVDIETSGLSFKKDRILGLGIGDTYQEFNERHGVLGVYEATAHNGKFEAKFLRANNLSFDWQFDTLLAASILINRPRDLDLASVAKYYLGTESWKSDTDKLFKKKNWVQLLKADPKLQEALAERNVYDLKATTKLTEVLLHQLEKENMTAFFFEKLMPAARLLADVEYRGMRIDVEATRQKLVEIDNLVVTLKAQLDKWAIGYWSPFKGELNWNSPIQLKRFLTSKGYNLFAYDFKSRSVKESTSSDVLESLLPNENIQILLDYRGANKLHAFLSGWLEDQIDGYIYPSYNVASTRTGRLSCSGPNLQQVPRDKSIRSLFIPSPGKVFVIGDYAQIEVRVAAHYTKDEALTEVFTEGLDFYGSIANRVLGTQCHPNEVKIKFPEDRKVAKEIGLSILYGIGAQKLSSIIKKRTGRIFSKEECAQIIKDYFKAYPRLLEFRNYVINKVEAGEIIRTKYGRQFRIDPEKSFSTGTNTIIQSTASDSCLFSQLTIEEELKKVNIYAPLIGLIHDEVVRECDPKDAQTVGELMERIMCAQGFNCPIRFEWVIGDSWGAKK